MGFPRQEYCSGLPCPPPGDLPNPGIGPASLLHRQVDSFTTEAPGKPYSQILCLLMQETQVQSLGQEDPLEEEMATHSSILAQEISWTEEPGGLQSMGWQNCTQLSA